MRSNMSNYLDSELPWPVVWELLVPLSCTEPCLSCAPPRCGVLGALLLRCRSWAGTPHMKQLNSRGFIRFIDIHCDIRLMTHVSFLVSRPFDTISIENLPWELRQCSEHVGTEWTHAKDMFVVGSWQHSLSLPHLMQPHGRRWPADCTTAAHDPKSPSEIFRKKKRLEELGPDKPGWKFQGWQAPHALLNGRQTPYANANTMTMQVTRYHKLLAPLKRIQHCMTSHMTDSSLATESRIMPTYVF